MVGCCWVRQGGVGLGPVRSGKVRQGQVRQGSAIAEDVVW
jgi:hypothetical protein